MRSRLTTSDPLRYAYRVPRLNKRHTIDWAYAPPGWLGAIVSSCEEADAQFDAFFSREADFRFLVVDLKSEYVNISRYLEKGVNWVIVNGVEKYKPDVSWFHEVIRRCDHLYVPVFVLGLSGSVRVGRDRVVYFREKAGRDPAEWPEGLWRRETPDELDRFFPEG